MTMKTTRKTRLTPEQRKQVKDHYTVNLGIGDVSMKNIARIVQTGSKVFAKTKGRAAFEETVASVK